MTAVDTSRAAWKKSSYSGNNGGSCVEVAFVEGQVATRDSKDRSGPVLTFSNTDWTKFVTAVQSGSVVIPL